MANADRPNGFRPVKSKSGRPWNGTVRYIAGADRSSLTTNNHGDIYIGDPISVSSGLAIPAITNIAVLGVCVGVGNGTTQHGNTSDFDPDNLMQRYAPLADTSTVIAYVPADDMLFEVQTALDLDLIVGSLADTSITANTTAHGSRTTSLSSVELTTASSNDVRVIEIGDQVDNDETATNAKHLVQFEDIMYAQT